MNSKEPQAVLPVFERIQDGRLLLKVNGEIQKNPFGLFPDGSRIEVVPAPGQGSASGLEEEAMMRLQMAVGKLEQLSEARMDSSVGIVAAGLEDEAGLVYGLALQRRGRTVDGRPERVAFLTRDERQFVLLRMAGVEERATFQVDRYSGVAAGLEAAAEYLREQGVTTVLSLGVFEKVSLAVRQALEALGIRLDPYAATDWQEVLTGAVNAFRNA